MTGAKRGRPPTGKAETGSAERVRRFRAKAKKDGGKRLDLVLDRDAVDALLVCIGAHSGLTVGQLVGSLLQREAERLKTE